MKRIILCLILLTIGTECLKILSSSSTQSEKSNESLSSLFNKQLLQQSRILQEGWLKMVSTYWLQNSQAIPKSFEVNPAYSSDHSIPSDVSFYLYLFKNTLYILRKKAFDMINVYKSIQLDNLDDILQDPQQVDYNDQIAIDKLEGGLEDLGNFDEGKCFKLRSKQQGIDYNFCCESLGEKERWMNNLQELMSKRLKEEQNDQQQQQQQEYKLPNAFRSIEYMGGNGERVEESEWVTIHGWTECSVKCGGGFSYQQRRCIKGKMNQECIGDEVLQKTCNIQQCDQIQTQKRVLKPVVRSVSTSDRLQSYEPCVLKEGDLYLQLQIQNLKEQPKLPVRVVINNHTLTIFSNKQYESLYTSYDLKTLQVSSLPKPNASCFKLSDYRKDKTQTLCVIPMNLRKGETMEQQMREWMRVIEEFQFKCETSKRNSYEDSMLVTGIKNRLKDEYYKQSHIGIEKEKDNQKDILERTFLEAKNAKIVADLVKEITFQNAAIKEQIQKQKQTKDYIEKRLYEDTGKQSKEGCQSAEGEKQSNSGKGEEIDEEEGVDSLYKYVIGDIDQNAQKQMQEFKIVGLKQLQRLKKINERKLSVEKKEVVLFRQSKADEIYQSSLKGESEKCKPSTKKSEREKYCEEKVKKRSIYKYMDCVYGSAIDYCFACCETEYGDEQMKGRSKCYLLCVAEKVEGLQGVQGQKQDEQVQDCQEKVNEHKQMKQTMDQLVG